MVPPDLQSVQHHRLRPGRHLLRDRSRDRRRGGVRLDPEAHHVLPRAHGLLRRDHRPVHRAVLHRQQAQAWTAAATGNQDLGLGAKVSLPFRSIAPLDCAGGVAVVSKLTIACQTNLVCVQERPQAQAVHALPRRLLHAPGE